MNIEAFREYCLAKAGVTESFPFDEHVLVFKVANKMFAASNISWEVFHINLKCDPEKAIELRDEYPEIEPGFHMNKKHWNTINLEGDLSLQLVKELIDHSYHLVVSKLPKKTKAELLGDE